jgi:hypothetical protein
VWAIDESTPEELVGVPSTDQFLTDAELLAAMEKPRYSREPHRGIPELSQGKVMNKLLIGWSRW